MQRLDELQSHFRDAVVCTSTGRLAAELIGGSSPEKRLAVHQRNYQTSLVDALLMKFPATGWLLGTPLLVEAAKRFVQENPPSAPCIAEYGADFPNFLKQYVGNKGMSYIGEFVQLEWYVGKVAIAVDQPSLDGTALRTIAEDALPEALITLQSGLHYQHASWPVDELLTMYLNETTPDQFRLTPTEVWIEITGKRGEFQLNRLDAAEFVFRKVIAQGRSIGDAAELAMDIKRDFDPGRALAALLANGLVTGIAK
jgi:hypothetical protein